MYSEELVNKNKKVCLFLAPIHYLRYFNEVHKIIALWEGTFALLSIRIFNKKLLKEISLNFVLDIYVTCHVNVISVCIALV